MTFISRICLILVLFLAVIFVPTRAWCVKMDPYAFTTVVGTVFFEYGHEKRDERTGNFESTTNQFNQSYSLSVTGNIVSRLLMIYDTSVTYGRNSSTTSTDKSINNNLGFNISTTLIPRSIIPLTLFVNRSTSWGSFNGGSSDSSGNTSTTYGLNWLGKFKVLPVMGLNITREVLEGSGDLENKKLRINYRADKVYGPTVNHFSYNTDFNEGTSGISSTSSNIAFSNRTQVSKYSTFNLGVTRDKFGDNAEVDRTNKTLSLVMGLNSTPSRFFTQTHNLSHYRTEVEDSKSNGTTYSGHLDYKVSEKVKLNLSLGVAKQFSESLTSKEDTTDTTASSTFAYKLTERLSLTQAFSASFTETSSSDQTNVNLGDRKVLRYTTNLSYYRKFSRVNLNTSYGLGYLWETERTSAVSNNDDGGQGITHNGSLSLNSIDFNRFFLFNTGASFRDVLKSTAGKLTDKSHRYYMNFDNRFWTNVFTLRGSYEKENSTDAIDEIKESEEVSRISVTSSPIKGGRLTFGVQRRVYFTDLVGRSTSNSGDVSAGYGHTLFGGSFGTSASYSLGRDTFEGGDSTRRTYSYFNFSYERSLLWRVLWKFNTDLTNISVDDTFSRSYAFTNSLFYRLRAWSLSLDHSYTISQTSTTDNRVNKIFLRVGRQFLRMF